MFRNTYDSENTVFSPQGRLHQVEYALEAVKQGSAVVGLRSNTHAILVALKRAPSELASYQKKMLRIDNHIGIGFSGLTSDARVLSTYMRQLALSSRLVYSRPLPLSRVVDSLADRAQFNTMDYGKRPYGVGFLIIGVDSTGPHLYEFTPTANCFEYYAMSIGARSQSAKTYLERKYDEFSNATLEELVLHGLYALRDTLPQNKDLELDQVSVAVVGPGADADVSSPHARRGEKFRVVEGDELRPYMDKLEPKTLPGARATATTAATAEATEGVGEGDAAPATGGDAPMED
ncbi:probable PRE5-20S proteasome subunit (alpha6) [Sporisorium reilianum SRZ2]|uniref:Proteasome subunit alpha type n=2 Tax=Sporisorium reilianum TaxID=72558 RepID=E6ZQL1_SPORE|nr:probable PRE5-20S proteasome subunit (alpha6) [Sporisorium reilianum SRZ2]SJX65161.1 probable PRE5-20S proteasome subunit (alpha6) [Sporisorium reilianum f. sp. reilianum]